MVSDNQQWMWRPAMDGVFVESAAPAGARITVAGSKLQEVDLYGYVLDTYPLPDDLRLCRRVPAPQAQGVSEPLYHTPLYCHVDHAGDEAWIALTPYPDDGSADGVMFSSQYWDTGIPQDVYALFKRVAEMTQQPAPQPQAQGVPVEEANWWKTIALGLKDELVRRGDAIENATDIIEELLAIVTMFGGKEGETCAPVVDRAFAWLDAPPLQDSPAPGAV